jgi:hypothetical protein
MIDEIAEQEVPALRAFGLFKGVVTTPSRAWLLNAGPAGLHSYFPTTTNSCSEIPEVCRTEWIHSRGNSNRR